MLCFQRANKSSRTDRPAGLLNGITVMVSTPFPASRRAVLEALERNEITGNYGDTVFQRVDDMADQLGLPENTEDTNSYRHMLFD